MLEGIIAKLAGVIIAIISASSYAGVMLLMAIESACIPLPSEVIMPFSGYLVHTGQFQLWLVATAGAIGCNLGSVVAYELGYLGGRPLVERYGRYIWLNAHDLEMADRFFQRYGSIAIFLGRLLPVIRTFIALPAGIAKMPRGRFHLYTFLGSWPWCFLLAYIGMKLGDHWNTLGKYFHRFDAVIGIFLVAGFIWFVRSHWKNRVRKETPVQVS
jgi:membrane protein DedA with SNARE-associated domain